MFRGMSDVVKVHACGSRDNMRSTTRSEWPTLFFVGHMQLDDEHDAELRNCTHCNSTIAIEVPRAR